MITKNKFSYILWNSVSESADKRYRHHLIKVYTNKQNEFLTELKSYMQMAHEDARQHLRRVLGTPLDPLGELTGIDPAENYPQLYDMHTLKGYFGEIFAGLIAEHCSPFGEDTWKVPAFLFRFHLVELQQLEQLSQTGGKANRNYGRTGDDCLAFQLDNNGQIVRSLYCEAKCTASHRSKSVSDAFEKVSKSEIVDIPRLIEILLDSTEPNASQWVDALRQFRLSIRLGTLPPDYERCDMVCYVCRRPGPKDDRTRLPIDRPHPNYKAKRRLEAVEVQLPDVEGLIREVYGIKDSTEVLDPTDGTNKDNDNNL